MKSNASSALSHSNAQQESKKRLLLAAELVPEDVLKQFGTTTKGLSEENIEKQRQRYGSNIITHQKNASAFRRFIGAFLNPFTLVLFIIAIVTGFTNVIMAPVGSKDPSVVIIVVVMVLISGILKFVQEARSSKAAEKLSEMVKTTIAVNRQGKSTEELPISEIVVGDIISLAAGDMIPADVRIVQQKDLFISQSSLTGESEPIEKISSAMATEQKEPLELGNLAFMGSTVVSGSALGMVINVGNATIFGSLAQELSEKKPLTSFEKGVNSITWVLIRFMLVMVPIVFLLSGFRSGNWMQAFLFAISVAVGLTPDLLPTIVSVNLAKGMVSLSKKKVIVKDLNSIQNLGAMDILCTDKTGTLTKDEVSLMYSLDANGNKDEDVLKYAYLNSYYQTGLKNLMDVAVINYASKHAEDGEQKDFKKIDEIPFDFARRRMSVVVSDENNHTKIITKGAVEEILSICTQVRLQGQIQPLSDELRATALSTVESYNKDGMRVVGVAIKDTDLVAGSFAVKDESDMVLAGYLSFLDPPKDSSENAIKALHNYGVTVKVLTGDNAAVTGAICKKVGVKADTILLGADIEKMDDATLDAQVEMFDVFAKLSPPQKARIITSLRRKGHTVGYMGDGINDAAAMKQSDVGISVDTAVDVAKESANIILLEKDLMVLKDGIVDGRKTYGNIIKYIKMTVSSNFGNMLSVLAASAFLPFLPMLPLQLIVLNLIYDISCIGIPWDNVDPEFLLIPRKWEASSLTKFMLWIGPTSSIFDISTYLMMFFVIAPMVAGEAYGALTGTSLALFISIFQTGWFIESLWTQTLVIHMIRTPKIPFIQSHASLVMTIFTSAGIIFGTLIQFTPLGKIMGMSRLPWQYYVLLVATVLIYVTIATIVKKMYVKRYKELL